jgi:hypothetical protein
MSTALELLTLPLRPSSQLGIRPFFVASQPSSTRLIMRQRSACAHRLSTPHTSRAYTPQTAAPFSPPTHLCMYQSKSAGGYCLFFLMPLISSSSQRRSSMLAVSCARRLSQPRQKPQLLERRQPQRGGRRNPQILTKQKTPVLLQKLHRRL